MRVRAGCVLAVAMVCGAALQAQTAAKAAAGDRMRLIGAWHLVSLQAVGAEGKVAAVPGLKGTLLYTRDGHMSVQIMYPPSSASLSNDYVLNGYEASFGSFSIDPATHTVTHHVQGSITHALVGKTLVRRYRFISGGRLMIRSTRPEEHWSVIWEHD